jgi:hypothetical protein
MGNNLFVFEYIWGILHRMARRSEIVIRPNKWVPNLKDDLQALANANKESLNLYLLKVLSHHIKTKKTKSKTVGTEAA